MQIPTPTIVAESDFGGGHTETVVSGPDGRYTSRSQAGESTQEFLGTPSQGEGNVAAALHRLADTLNDHAGERIWTEGVGHKHVSVDGTLAADDGEQIDCQVTRVERQTLRKRGRDGAATAHVDSEGLVQSVMAAIESKLSSADPQMFLVLDANDAPAYTDGWQVADLACARLNRLSYGGAWREIWLIGPTTARSQRIDVR